MRRKEKEDAQRVLTIGIALVQLVHDSDVREHAIALRGCLREQCPGVLGLGYHASCLVNYCYL